MGITITFSKTLTTVILERPITHKRGYKLKVVTINQKKLNKKIEKMERKGYELFTKWTIGGDFND